MSNLLTRTVLKSRENSKRSPMSKDTKQAIAIIVMIVFGLMWGLALLWVVTHKYYMSEFTRWAGWLLFFIVGVGVEVITAAAGDL